MWAPSPFIELRKMKDEITSLVFSGVWRQLLIRAWLSGLELRPGPRGFGSQLVISSESLHLDAPMIHCIQRALLTIACLIVLCPQSAFAYTGTEQAQTSAPQSAPAGGAGAIVYLARHAPKLLTAVSVFRPTATAMDIAPDGVLGALKKLLDKIEDIDAPLIAACLKQQCFVAGTMVATVTGAVAIENIEPGMAVLSAPEESGEKAIVTSVTTAPECASQSTTSPWPSSRRTLLDQGVRW